MSAKALNFATAIATVLLVLIASWQVNATARVARSDLAATVAELTRLSDNWDKVIVRKDKVAIADNMAADFRQIASNGDVANKEEFVRDLTSDDLTIDPYTVEDFDVRVYGDVALLSGTTRMTGRSDGKPFASHYRYIDVYRRVDGKWKVCSVQTTKFPN